MLLVEICAHEFHNVRDLSEPNVVLISGGWVRGREGVREEQLDGCGRGVQPGESRERGGFLSRACFRRCWERGSWWKTKVKRGGNE